MAKRGVIIVAGGSGRRMGGTLPKQFMLLGGMPVVGRTINTFAEALPGCDIVVVLPEEHIPLWKNLASRFDIAPHRCVAGGRERFHSVARGIEALPPQTEYIAVHDGVRALVSKALIIRAMLAAEEHKAVIPVTEVVNSYRRVLSDGTTEHLDRSMIRIVQTPQIFRAEILREAYKQPYNERFTDDASVVEAAGHKVDCVDGEARNIKLTTPEDMEYAEWLLSR